MINNILIGENEGIGIYVEMVQDYNESLAIYSGSGENRKRITPIIPGFNVKIDLLQRDQYCRSYGIPTFSELYPCHIWHQTHPGPILDQKIDTYENSR